MVLSNLTNFYLSLVLLTILFPFARCSTTNDLSQFVDDQVRSAREENKRNVDFRVFSLQLDENAVIPDRFTMFNENHSNQAESFDREKIDDDDDEQDFWSNLKRKRYAKKVIRGDSRHWAIPYRFGKRGVMPYRFG